MTIIDGRTLASGEELRFDVCIVGAGAAGITLALELSKSALSVLLVESGGYKPDPETQSLYEGDVIQPHLHSNPRYYRIRRFGGSTTKWGGGCVPFDAIDFEERAYVPESGWPFGRSELDKYYPRANELLEAGDFSYDAWEALPEEAQSIIPGFESSCVNTQLIERNSPPTNFGARYRSELERSRSVTVLLNSNCVNIAPTPDLTAVDHLDVATLSGVRFRVRAQEYVLAMGGLEIPRILLASRGEGYENGIGNQSGLVGRYYLRHLSASVGVLSLGRAQPRLNYGITRSSDGIYCRRLFSLTAEKQRSLGVGNIILRLWHLPIADPAHESGPLSALFLLHHCFAYERKRWLRGEAPASSQIHRHLQNILMHPMDTCAFSFRMLTKHILARRKYPAVTPPSKDNKYGMNFVAEQSPNPESRVRLSERVDPLGVPRIVIDWRCSEFDVDSVKQTYKVVADEFARCGVGRLDYSDEEIDEKLRRNGAFDGHQMGTTRMSDDPTKGVVNRDCRVHGLSNLYVSGAAVFPTGSHALPTLTIVAMAVRLAAHLRAVLT